MSTNMTAGYATATLRYPLLAVPGSLNVVGGSFSGKSTLVSNLLRYKEELFDKPPKHVVYCFLEDPGKLFDGIPNFHPFKGLPSEEDMSSWVDDYGAGLCIVFDDLGSDLFNSSDGRDLLTKWVHHKVFIL